MGQLYWNVFGMGLLYKEILIYNIHRSLCMYDTTLVYKFIKRVVILN